MTCIVGIEMNGKACIGGDSAGIADYEKTIRADEKVFRLGEMVMGFTSSFRMGQLLRFKLILPEQSSKKNDYQFMCTDFIDSVINCLESNGYSKISENKKTGGTFIVAYKNKIYVVESDFQVGIPSNGIASVGCGAPYAKGALTALYEYFDDPEKLARRALEISAEHSAGVNGPFITLVN